jgi:quinol monooxygenase YgiN
MTRHDVDGNSLVLINTFTVDPARSEELLHVLTQATEDVMQHMAGFISANLHISTDKCHVANYAQWRSMDDVKAMMKQPQAQSHMKIAADIAESFQPIFYTLRESITAEPRR